LRSQEVNRFGQRGIRTLLERRTAESAALDADESVVADLLQRGEGRLEIEAASSRLEPVVVGGMNMPEPITRAKNGLRHARFFNDSCERDIHVKEIGECRNAWVIDQCCELDCLLYAAQERCFVAIERFEKDH
jgi:hypothetical protein